MIWNPSSFGAFSDATMASAAGQAGLKSRPSFSPVAGPHASCLQGLLRAASYRGSYFQQALFQRVPRP